MPKVGTILNHIFINSVCINIKKNRVPLMKIGKQCISFIWDVVKLYCTKYWWNGSWTLQPISDRTERNLLRKWRRLQGIETVGYIAIGLCATKDIQERGRKWKISTLKENTSLIVPSFTRKINQTQSCYSRN